MGSNLNDAFMFTAGVLIGSFVTWKFIKDRYERIANEEIESVKETFGKKKDISEPKTVNEKNDKKETTTLNLYRETLNENSYTNYSDVKKEEPRIEEPHVEEPYLITPDEFGENMDYDTVTWTYYADGKLADEMDKLVEDADNVVGTEYVDGFGEWEDDVVHVRNDHLKIDFEILADARPYSESMGGE